MLIGDLTYYEGYLYIYGITTIKKNYIIEQLSILLSKNYRKYSL